ncbi:MAG: hypothetical protein ACRCTX_04720, partial [Afipia sp.]
MKTNKDLVHEAMTRIEHIREHTRAVEAAAYHLSKRYRQRKIDYKELRDALFMAELDEWRNMFLFAITLDIKERDRVKAA